MRAANAESPAPESGALESLVPLTVPHGNLPSTRLKFLRSSLFLSIISLLLLTGYASEIFCDCHGGHSQEMTEHGDSTPATGDDCQCVCHQMISDVFAAPMQLRKLLSATLDAVPHTDQFPPDAVPLGIEYPPQRA